MMDLYQAAALGDTDAIRTAAEQGYDVSTPNTDGKTPLWFAVQNGHSDACSLLVTRGADIYAQNLGILEVAVQGRHADIVATLWPHCKAEKEHRSLESAISLGFHEIAGFLIGTGEFEYQHLQANRTDLLMGQGFPERDTAAFQQWKKFLFDRNDEQLNLNHLFFDYALLLSTKADRNAGLRLVQLLLKEPTPMADVNCRIKINGQFETPLTAAAEAGNLKILTALIDHRNTSLTICGKYDWPAFLHFIACDQSIITEEGRAIAQRLSIETYPDHCLIDSWEIGSESGLETVFKNVLRFGDDTLVKQVIELVKYVAGILIIPVLIRANELSDLKWLIYCDTMHASQPPPILWVLLCDYLLEHPRSDALGLFTRVAELLVKKGIWSRIILNCLDARNLSLVRQVFCYLQEVTEDAIVGFPEASTDQSLLEEWANYPLSNAKLWHYTHCRISGNPAFENLSSCPSIDPNGSDPHEGLQQSN